MLDYQERCAFRRYRKLTFPVRILETGNSGITGLRPNRGEKTHLSTVECVAVVEVNAVAETATRDSRGRKLAFSVQNFPMPHNVRDSSTAQAALGNTVTAPSLWAQRRLGNPAASDSTLLIFGKPCFLLTELARHEGPSLSSRHLRQSPANSQLLSDFESAIFAVMFWLVRRERQSSFRGIALAGTYSKSLGVDKGCVKDIAMILIMSRTGLTPTEWRWQLRTGVSRTFGWCYVTTVSIQRAALMYCAARA